MIYDSLLYLPQESFTDEELILKTANVYQHIFTNYYGNGRSVYGKGFKFTGIFLLCIF
jgi:type I restriction enzyme R subunit